LQGAESRRAWAGGVKGRPARKRKKKVSTRKNTALATAAKAKMRGGKGEVIKRTRNVIVMTAGKAAGIEAVVAVEETGRGPGLAHLRKIATHLHNSLRRTSGVVLSTWGLGKDWEREISNVTACPDKRRMTFEP